MLMALIAAVGLAVADGSDREREARLAAEIEESIVVGDPVYLEADGHPFLAIFTESDEPRGTALILHGRGYHPDWPLVAGPLREGLADVGWNTLSIQLPVLAKDATYYDYVPIFPEAYPRIESALAYLRELGEETVVLIAHSCGVHMAMAYVDVKGDSGFEGFVGIGMGATDYRQTMEKPFPLDRMAIPVLDVYGEAEFPGVLRMAPERKATIAAAGHSGSRQIVVPDADHYFEGDDATAQLLDTVANWLNTTDFRRP
jgi:pimeloyl-ACP methyl ester carboxylesterase